MFMDLACPVRTTNYNCSGCIRYRIIKILLLQKGAGIVQWVERQTRD